MNKYVAATLCLGFLFPLGCSKGSKCQRTAEQHCSKYSDDELVDQYGGNADDGREECTRGYAANCKAEEKFGGNIPLDVIIDPSSGN
jgi:hypothetical protein